MKFPIAFYCSCGVKAIYVFAAQDAANEYKRLWLLQHSGNGHESMNERQYRKLTK